MSLSFSLTIRQQPAYGSALVVLGMLMAAVLIVALSAAADTGALNATTILVYP